MSRKDGVRKELYKEKQMHLGRTTLKQNRECSDVTDVT